MHKVRASINSAVNIVLGCLLIQGAFIQPALSDALTQGQGGGDEQSINSIAGPDGPALERQPNGGSWELGGILVDRTISMAGKTFYRSFSQLAIENPFISEVTLTIVERPDARWGSQIWVMEGNKMYFRTQLSPRINEADRAAAEAVQRVEAAIIRNQLASALPGDKDLGREELP